MERHPVVRRWSWGFLATGVLALGGAAAIALFSLRAPIAWHGVVAALVVGVVAVLCFSRARRDACSRCGATMLAAIVRLPVDIAQPLAEAVERRGSLAPALPNHLAHAGQTAYCMLVGDLCPACRRTARVHVAKVQSLSGQPTESGTARLAIEPLSTIQPLDEESAAFLATLAVRL